MKKSNYLFMCIMILYLSIFVFISPYYSPLSPDENIFLFFSNNLFNNDLILGYSDSLNRAYDTNLIHPRGAVYVPDNNSIRPIGSFGPYLLFGLIRFLFKINLLFFVLISILGLILYFYLITEIFNKKQALLSTLLFSLFPIYLYWFYRPMSDIIALSFLFGGLLFLLKFNKSNDTRHILISSIFFGLSIIFRYVNIIPTFIFILFFFQYDKLFDKGTFHINFFKKILLFGSVLIIFASTILIFNNIMFGSFFKFGYNFLSDNALIITKPLISEGFVLDMINNLDKFLIQFLGFLFVLSLLFSIYALRFEKGNLIRYSLSYLCLLSIYLLYFGTGNFYGINSPSINLASAHFRYYLILYSMMIPSFIFIIDKQLKKIQFVVLSILVGILFLSISLSEDYYGLLKSKEDMILSSERNAFFLTNLPEESFIFTLFNDKIIFPHRLRVVDYYNNGIDSKEIRIENTISLAKNLLKDKKKVFFIREEFSDYIVQERGYIDFNIYVQEFNKVNINTILIKGNIYELKLKNE